MELNDKLLEKAKKAKNAEELAAVAKENGFELTEEEAKPYFAKLNAKEGELAMTNLIMSLAAGNVEQSTKTRDQLL